MTMRGSVGRVERMGGQERETAMVLGFEKVFISGITRTLFYFVNRFP